MRTVALCGFKKSGKTSLIALVAAALEQKGLRAGIVKFCHHPLDKAHTDTFQLAAPKRAVIGAAPGETAVFMPWELSLPQMAASIQADALLVEGGKKLGILPRILCLKTGDREEFAALAGSREGSPRGLTLATVGARPADLVVPHFSGATPETAEALAGIVMNRGFLLPGMDCGACGQKNCAALAKNIVSGEASPDDCAVLHAPIRVNAGGSDLPLNPFVAAMLSGGVRGMLQSLKGIQQGRKIILELDM